MKKLTGVLLLPVIISMASCTSLDPVSNLHPAAEKLRAPSGENYSVEEFAFVTRFPQIAIVDGVKCVIPQGTPMTYARGNQNRETPLLHTPHHFNPPEISDTKPCQNNDFKCRVAENQCRAGFKAKFSKAQMNCHLKGVCPTEAVLPVRGETDAYSCHRIGYAVHSGSEVQKFDVEYEDENGEWVTYRQEVSGMALERAEMECDQEHYSN